MPTNQYTEIAARGGAQLAAAMTTERWPGVRDAAQRIFALAEPERCAVLAGELDQDRDLLSAAAIQLRDPIRDLVAGRWEARLVKLLAAHMAVHGELAALIESMHAVSVRPEVTRTVVHRQAIVARRQGTAVGAQAGNVYYYASALPAPSPPPEGSRVGGEGGS